MNCPTVDKLSRYADNLLSEEEYAQIHMHLKGCLDCIHVVKAFEAEEEFLKETLQTPSLPNDFASGVLERLEPYEQKVNRKK
ncbi:anti-sigma factor family protein [Robertmurraya andreesenii]|uniref:Anti-sigma-W factor RsiW n=1 Tax=Anoxybacillus andreesenii TaxID=1325932 RepID=A0ABT9V478_9BACL|nr:zf-HC2 domain-containing protein [Robertmurraya andreesenii]MDQ0155746.1 anti-sigma factor RsiW [Robertmurraya andreesenii]